MAELKAAVCETPIRISAIAGFRANSSARNAAAAVRRVKFSATRDACKAAYGEKSIGHRMLLNRIS